ncbi:MAG: hypothetical protein WAU81_13110 [Candidatus Aminicenantales bacterium]
MVMIRFFYHFIVLYLSFHLLWYLVRRKKLWSQAGAALVLTLFLLRLFLVK